MSHDVIGKSAQDLAQANMQDYATERASFSWDEARELLDGLPGGKLNIAYEAVDRHVNNGGGDKTAFRLIAKDESTTDISYRDLMHLTNRFANALQSLGVEKGDRVYSLLGRVPQLYIAVLGTLKAGCVFSPLFSAFGPEPVKSRLEIGGGNVLVTTRLLYKRKVAPVRDQLPELRHILLIDGEDADQDLLDLAKLMDAASEEFEVVATDPEDLALLHFTSGTTGKPKGAMHVHQAVVAHNYTGRTALDLHPDDIFWCTADPGWVTGTSYGIIAPLTNGVTMIIDEAEFDAERWYRILANHKVNVWYTAPTAIRMLMKAGGDLAEEGGSLQSALHGERRRAAQPGSRDVGRQGARQAVSRQLVADRDRRHHDRQLRLHGRQARLDGQTDAGHRGGYRGTHRRRRAGGHQADGAWRTGVATRLAVDDARLSA